MSFFLEIKVTPNAKKPMWKVEGTTIRCFLNEQPQDGKANKALIKALSKALGIPQHDIELTSGGTSRTKKFKIWAEIAPEKVFEKIKNAKPPQS